MQHKKHLQKIFHYIVFIPYFLTAADNLSPILYTVTRLRDGKSFETRSVTARQDDRTVFECSMNFHRKEKGNMEHQIAMPTGIFFINLKYNYFTVFRCYTT